MIARRLMLAGAGAASVGALFATSAMAAAASPPARRHRIPNVELKTHTGKSVRFYDDLVRDKLVAINMMYALCNSTCPPMTRNLVRVQELLGSRVGKDVFMYSISARPEQDTPQDLANYAKLHGVRPGWLFLTGRQEDVDRVRFALGFYDVDPEIDKEPSRHVGMVRIGHDPHDRWGMAPSLAAPEQIVSAIRHVERRPQRSTA